MNINKKLFKHQFDFVTSTAERVCFSGGVACGKTLSAITRFMNHLIKYKTVGLMCRISKIETKKALLPDLEKDWGSVIESINKMDGIIRLKNGSEIIMEGGWDDEKGIAHLDGYNISVFLISQGEMFLEASYRALQRRNRREGVPEHIEIIECNPPSAEHWIAKEFYNTCIESEQNISFNNIEFKWKQYIGKDSYALKMPSQQFPFLPKGFIEKIKKDTSTRNIEKYINGEFGRHTGLVYPCFNKGRNVIEPFIVKREINKKRYIRGMGLDVGFNNPTAFIHFIYDIMNDNYYFIKEYYESDKTNRTNAELIYDELLLYDFDCIIVDPAINQTNKSTGLSDLSEYKDVWGDEWEDRIINGINDVEFGIDLVYTQIERGKVYVFPTLSNFFQEIENYKYKNTVNLNQKSVPVKKDDHLMDAMRLIIASKDRWTNITEETEQDYDKLYKELNNK